MSAKDNGDIFDLDATLFCGQCFSWDRLPGGGYAGASGDRALFLCDPSRDLPRALADPFWRGYFDWDFPYAQARAQFSAMDPILKEAAAFAPDIHILNQDPWEALCSFIISQNNNIPRITGIVRRLCRTFGSPLEKSGDWALFSFPRPERLANCTPGDLAPLRCGFRARYLIDAAQKVSSGKVDLKRLRTMPLTEAREQLMQIVGVGVKVADCALLYGLHRLEVFPMDVWMKRVMARWFAGKNPDCFGPYAGIAQQYLFHYSRNHPECFTEDEARERVS